jgi:serine/threonine-protein kinase
MQPGQQIGPFTIEKELGAGAMGAVYRGVYNKTGQRVAIKVMLPGAAENKQSIDRFRREVDILKQLNHPNIVRLLYSDKYNGARYYAMEYIQGESMDRMLTRRGRLSWEEVVTLGQQLCAALQHAHDKGVVHRDLKPANLMVLPDGSLKLTDFGIAKDLDVTQLTEANCTVGTASYMSPEQCRGERNLTHKSDLYSLGIVLYELLTGKKPFVADNVMDMFMMHVKGTFARPVALVVDIPKWLDILVCQLLEKKPEQRPRDAATVGQALSEVMEKVEARQSAGVETARAGKAEETDREAAQSLLSGKKKKKKKKAAGVPLHRRTWVKAAGLLLALAGVILAGWLVLKPPSADSLYKSIERRMNSEDPDAWKAAYKGPIHDYLKRFGGRDDEQTRQVKIWNDQVGVLIAEEDLEKTVAAARKIDESKMDALTPAERVALKAAQAEDEGDLAGAQKSWEKLISEHAGEGHWDKLAAYRINFQFQEVHKLRNRLQELLDTMEQRPEDELKLDEQERVAFTARRFEEVGDKVEAHRRWEAIKKDLQKKPQQRTWFLLAASRAKVLKDQLPSNMDVTEWRTKKVRAFLDGAEKLRAESHLLQAQAACRHIVDLYADAPDKEFKPLHEEAARLLERIQKERGVQPK